MRIRKWIKLVTVLVLTAGITVSAAALLHASGQKATEETDNKETKIPVYTAEIRDEEKEKKEQTPASAEIDSPRSPESGENKTPPPCGVSDDADKLFLFVRFQVLESSAEGCRIEIENHSGRHTLTTSLAFRLEGKRNGEYVPISYHTAPCWPDIAYIAEPGDTVKLDFDWSASYGSLPPGEYRIELQYFSQNSAFTEKVLFTVK